ncbi:MAG TPA: flagellar type III secretion system pore protein FliP [Oscillatoriaceae cyanobacterium]
MNWKRILPVLAIALGGLALFAGVAHAADLALPSVNIGLSGSSKPQDVSVTLQIIMLLTVLSLAPAILVLMTAFTRIVIVLSFVRQAIGTQVMPPNQVVIGLALFLTFFVMAPVANDIYTNAYTPYTQHQITQAVAFDRAQAPVRQFMLRQTREQDLSLFVKLAKLDRPRTIKDVPTYVMIPAFVTSELKTAFQIGFVIYLPFLIIDMVVASILMSMGMMMLPPAVISLPFKIILFVLVDGWNLLCRALVTSFR